MPCEDQIDLLCTLVDPEALKLINSLQLATDDKNDSDSCFDIILEVLNEPGFKMKERWEINNLQQEEGECIAEYAVRVLKCTDLMYHGAHGIVKDVRDKVTLDTFIHGLREDKIGVAMIENKFKSFKEAYRKALKLEDIIMSAATRNQITIVTDHVELSRKQDVSSSNQQNITITKTRLICDFCGIKGHGVVTCHKRLRRNKRQLKRRLAKVPYSSNIN